MAGKSRQRWLVVLQHLEHEKSGRLASAETVAMRLINIAA